MSIRICKYCGKEFEPIHGNQLSCSKECRIKHRIQVKVVSDEQKIKRNTSKKLKLIQNYANNPKTCKTCNKEFIQTHGRQEYCSPECKQERERIKNRESYVPTKYSVPGACAICGNIFNKIHPDHKYCSEKCSSKAAQKKETEKYVQYRLEHPKTCVECGVLFNWNDNKQIYCSKKCVKKHNNRNHPKLNSKKRKRIKQLKANGEYDNSVTLEALRLRYKDVCAICGKKVSPKDFVWRNGTFIVGIKYPSIDHILPVSKGGTHTWDNVQLAHMDCNSFKNANNSYETATGQIRLSI